MRENTFFSFLKMTLNIIEKCSLLEQEKSGNMSFYPKEKFYN
jgi:hypothetical protein